MPKLMAPIPALVISTKRQTLCRIRHMAERYQPAGTTRCTAAPVCRITCRCRKAQGHGHVGGAESGGAATVRGEAQ